VTIIPQELTGMVEGDPTRLRQLLNNLLSNAVKFTEVGEVTLRLKRLEQSEKSSRYLFEVSDSGFGIPEEAQEWIFESFTQADGSTTRNYGGTGLGLAICKQLVKLFDGDIGFTSREEEGSTFWFTVHLKDVEQESPSYVAADAFAEIRALVVDDNETSRFALYKLLHSWGMHVQVIDRAEAALQAMNQALENDNPFDVVLVDQQMPECDGISLMGYMQGSPRLKGTKSVLMCSSSHKDVRGFALDAGFDNFITKPVRQRYLHDVIAVVLGRKEQLREEPGKPAMSYNSPLMSDQLMWPVLLVEDNLVNQKVATGMLKKLGCEVDIADNGQVAYEKFKKKHYWLVLMDCQMPILDGYAATKLIRNRERDRSLPHLPIVAMTAHAMEGDRDKCLEAGMDDYLSKPVKVTELKSMLEKWLLKGGALSKPMNVILHTESVPGGDVPHIDNTITREIIDCLGQDAFKDIALLFIKTGKELVGSLNSAYDQRDKEAMHYVAHTLKGSSGNIGARILFQLCETLDSNVQADANFDEMLDFVNKINDEFGYLVNHLKRAG